MGFFNTAKANGCVYFFIVLIIHTIWVNHTSCLMVSWIKKLGSISFPVLFFVLFSFKYLSSKKIFIEHIFGQASLCTASCRPSALKRAVGRALYFYQQSSFLLPTSQDIQQRSLYMDQGDTKAMGGGGWEAASM